MGRIARWLLACYVVALLGLLLPPQPPSAWADDAATFDEDPFATAAPVTIADPLEPLNRGVFWFNDKLYFYLLKPIARGYRVVPEPARISVSHFFDNLMSPVRFANNVLQFKFSRAGEELGRFVFNSTVGVLGLFDPADSWLDLKRRDEDTGQTLGHYGVGNGFYLVLPALGPSSLRDGVGRVGDYFLEPLSYADITWLEQGGIRAFDMVNEISLDKDTYEAIKREQLDPYLFIRDAYAQRRAAQVKE